nr:hypothetical protein [Tanacetum cinerariifolium]
MGVRHFLLYKDSNGAHFTLEWHTVPFYDLIDVQSCKSLHLVIFTDSYEMRRFGQSIDDDLNRAISATGSSYKVQSDLLPLPLRKSLAVKAISRLSVVLL